MANSCNVLQQTIIKVFYFSLPKNVWNFQTQVKINLLTNHTRSSSLPKWGMDSQDNEGDAQSHLLRISCTHSAFIQGLPSAGPVIKMVYFSKASSRTIRKKYSLKPETPFMTYFLLSTPSPPSHSNATFWIQNFVLGQVTVGSCTRIINSNLIKLLQYHIGQNSFCFSLSISRHTESYLELCL